VQTALRLVRDHGMIAIENLRIKNMTASAKGTVARPAIPREPSGIPVRGMRAPGARRRERGKEGWR